MLLKNVFFSITEQLKHDTVANIPVKYQCQNYFHTYYFMYLKAITENIGGTDLKTYDVQCNMSND